MTREQRKKEIMELLDRHPEKYDQVLKMLRENVPATTQAEPKK